MTRLGLLMPGSNNYSPLGLEMGATSIKMAQLQRTAKGWTVRDMLVKEIAVSNNENGRSRKDALIQTIKDGLKESSFSGRSVVSVMPEYQLDILPIKLTLSGDEGLEEAILEEAKAHLSYDVENAVIDYIPVENGESDPEKGKTARALLISARREDVDEHLSILKGANLKPIAMDISASALARVIGFSSTDKDKNALVINAGEQHTTFTLLWKDNILFNRNIPWGKDNMVESLMNRLKLDREKASGLLNRVGLLSRTGKEIGLKNESINHTSKISEAVYEIVAPPLEKLSKELDKVLQYFYSEMRGAAVDVLYLMGAVSAVKDLDTYLENRTGISTKHFNPIGALKVGENEVSKDGNGYVSLFGVALGLAMRGFENQDIKPER
jgi:type IV pilus assembly protein PilM